MKNDLYIDRIILKRPVDKNSYLADIPAVKALEKMDHLQLILITIRIMDKKSPQNL